MSRMVCALALAWCACSGSNGKGPGGLGEGLQPDDYPVVAKRALCQYMTRCGLFGNLDTCVASRLPIGTTLGHWDQLAAEAGTIFWDGVMAQACLDALAAQSCDQTSERARTALEACETFITGFTQESGSCVLWEECASGHCSQSNCSDACCPGTCEGAPFHFALVAIGGSCSYSAFCVSGAWCDHGRRPEGTPGGTCEPLLAQGAACTSSHACPYGLGCANGTCAALPVLGQGCSGGTQCRDAGTICAAGTCVAVGTEGAPCGETAPCAMYGSLPLFTCDATQHCSVGVPTGQSCANNLLCADEASACIRGVCGPRDPVGVSCTDNSTCDSYNCKSGHCAAVETCY